MGSYKYILGTIIYIAAVFLGTLIVKLSWDGKSYALYFGEDRNPAAFIKSFDFSPLNGRHLQVRSQERLLEEASVKVTSSHFEIKLGLFTVRDPSSVVIRPTLACNVYETIEVTFIAEGMAVNDSSPLLQISAPCKVDINESGMMAKLKIPLSVFHNRKIASDFSESFIESDVNVTIKNLSDSWPEKWSMYALQLKDKDGLLRPIEVTHDYILKLDPKVKKRLVLSNYRP